MIIGEQNGSHFAKLHVERELKYGLKIPKIIFIYLVF